MAVEDKIKEIIVELVMAIEEEFGLEIPDEDAERMQNIGDVISYVEERTAGRDD